MLTVRRAARLVPGRYLDAIDPDGATHPYEVDGVVLQVVRYTLAVACSGAPTSG